MAKGNSVDTEGTNKTAQDAAFDLGALWAEQGTKTPFLLVASSMPLELPETATIMDFTAADVALDLKTEILEVTEVAGTVSVAADGTVTEEITETTMVATPDETADEAAEEDSAKETATEAAIGAAALAAAANNTEKHKIPKSKKNKERYNKATATAEALDTLDASSTPINADTELSDAPKFTVTQKRTQIIWGMVTAVLAVATGVGLFFLAGDRPEGEALGSLGPDYSTEVEIAELPTDCAEGDASCEEAKSSESDSGSGDEKSDSKSTSDGNKSGDTSKQTSSSHSSATLSTADLSYPTLSDMEPTTSQNPTTNNGGNDDSNNSNNDANNSGSVAPSTPTQSAEEIACINSAAPNRLTFVEWHNAGADGSDAINLVIEEYAISSAMKWAGGTCLPADVQLYNVLSTSTYTSLEELGSAAATGDFAAQVALDSRTNRLIWSWPGGKALVENGTFYDIIDRRK